MPALPCPAARHRSQAPSGRPAWPHFDARPYIERFFCPESWTCWHLVLEFYRVELGIDLPQYGIEEYPAAKIPAPFAEAKTSGQWVEVDQERFGDVVTFSRRKGFDHHVGVVVARKTIMHVMEGGSTVLARYDHRGLAAQVSGVFRWVGEHPLRGRGGKTNYTE